MTFFVNWGCKSQVFQKKPHKCRNKVCQSRTLASVFETHFFKCGNCWGQCYCVHLHKNISWTCSKTGKICVLPGLHHILLWKSVNRARSSLFVLAYVRMRGWEPSWRHNNKEIKIWKIDSKRFLEIFLWNQHVGRHNLCHFVASVHSFWKSYASNSRCEQPKVGFVFIRTRLVWVVWVAFYFTWNQLINFWWFRFRLSDIGVRMEHVTYPVFGATSHNFDQNLFKIESSLDQLCLWIFTPLFLSTMWIWKWMATLVLFPFAAITYQCNSNDHDFETHGSCLWSSWNTSDWARKETQSHFTKYSRYLSLCFCPFWNSNR